MSPPPHPLNPKPWAGMSSEYSRFQASDEEDGPGRPEVADPLLGPLQGGQLGGAAAAGGAGAGSGLLANLRRGWRIMFKVCCEGKGGGQGRGGGRPPYLSCAPWWKGWGGGGPFSRYYPTAKLLMYCPTAKLLCVLLVHCRTGMTWRAYV